GGFSLGRLSNQLALHADNLVVGRMLGADALGLYGRAYSLMSAQVTLFGSVLDRVLFPALSRIQEQRDRITNAFVRGLAVMMLAAAPVSVIAWILGPEIIEVFLGSAWEAAVVPFQVLAVGTACRAGAKICVPTVRALGAVYRLAWRQSVYAFAVLSGAIIGSRWDLPGVALGVLVAIVLQYVLLLQLVVSVLDVGWIRVLRSHVPAAAVTIVVGALTLGIVSWMRSRGISPGAILLTVA